jgi:uncharacterized protein
MTLLKTLLLSSAVLSAPLYAASPLGDWQGTLEVNATTQFELVVHIQQQSDVITATLDVPAQGQFGLVFDKVRVHEQQVELAISAASISIKAELQQDSMSGQYQQGGFSAPLTLHKAQHVTQREAKLQEPKGELPYSQQQVSFVNTHDGGHALAGTLALPATPAQHTLILLSGSGPTNRDGDVFGHKIYLVLADLLARQGIAVLRFDDRGVGQSGGEFASATSADFASDAAAAVAFVRQHPLLAQTKVGFAGHSEGGLIAMIAAAEFSKVDQLVLLAAPGTTGEQLLIDQSFYIQQKMGMSSADLAADDKVQRRLMRAIAQDKTSSEIRSILAENETDGAKLDAMVAQLSSPWFRYFVKANPAHFLARLQLPVLALNGALDAQVLAEPNISGIAQAVDKNWLTSKIYPELNHLFQPATTGLPNEYAGIAMTFTPQVATDIATWLQTL